MGLRWLNMNFPVVAKSLVMDLDYLHAAGIIHGGKVKNLGLLQSKLNSCRYSYIQYRISNAKLL